MVNEGLIVMTTHGKTASDRWAYGSVAKRVIRGARCALFIVRQV